MKTPETEATKDGRPSGLAVAPCSALLAQIDALIAELMDHNKYPSPDAYVMASKLRRTLLGQPDAPSPNNVLGATDLMNTRKP